MLSNANKKAAYDIELAQYNGDAEDYVPLFDHRISPTSGYGRPIGMNTPETKEEMLAIAHQQLEHMRNQHAERHEDENDLNPDQSKVLLQFWRDMERRNATHSSLRAYCKIRADEYKGKLQAHRFKRIENIARKGWEGCRHLKAHARSLQRRRIPGSHQMYPQTCVFVFSS